MTDYAIGERWKHIAIALGDSVYQAVNTPDTVGTDDETGYILMFFNLKNHKGKSTFISSALDRAALKKLLKTALREIDGPKASIVEPTKEQ